MLLTVRRRAVLSALVLAPILLATGCTSSGSAGSAQPDVVSIGLVYPQTGSEKALGVDAWRGASLAIDVINNDYPALPLVLGPGSGIRRGTVKVKLVPADTAGAPEKAAGVVNQLAQQDVVGMVIAEPATEVVKNAASEADQTGLAMVDALSTDDEFAGLSFSANHFRIEPSDAAAAQAALNLLYEVKARQKRPVSKVAVLSGNAGEAKTVEGLARNAGYGLVGPISVDVAPSTLQTGVEDGNADVALAYITTPQEAATAAALAVRLRGSVPVIAFGPAVGSLSGAPEVGQSTVLRVATWSDEYARSNPVYYQLASLYRVRFGVGTMPSTAAESFTAMMALAQAMDQARTTGASDVRSAVQQLQVPATQTGMPWNGISFDGNGNNQLATPLIEQFTGTAFHIVDPAELADVPLIWP